MLKHIKNIKTKAIMKKILFAAAVLFAAQTFAQAQATKKTAVNGYGCGLVELTYINGKPALNIGGYGGVLLNHRFLIGASGANVLFRHKVNGSNQSMSFNYYGLYTEYRMPSTQWYQFSVGLTSAMGWQENKLVSTNKANTRRDGNITYVFQPRIGVNAKLTTFMQLQGYASYRFTGNTKSTYYNRSNYNGASIGMALVFGGF
jgi:hypothetical protein